MKFTELDKKEALEFISTKRYNTIINGNPSDETKFELWINIIEKYKLNPCEITINDFYK